MTQKTTRIIIPRDGITTGDQSVRAVYDATSSKMLEKLGETSTMRASHVEPGNGLSVAALEILQKTRTHFKVVDKSEDGQLKLRKFYENHWFADMTPTGHAVVLGPYYPHQRQQALDDEVTWLQKNNIPVCDSCRESSSQ